MSDIANPELTTKTGIRSAKSVFISYGREDALAFAKRLAADMENRGGYDVWMDLKNIEEGGLFEVRIEYGIRNASVVLALMTPHSFREESVCRDEVIFALNEGKPVVPVKLYSDPNLKPSLLLARRHWIDFTQEYETAFKSLLRYLSGDKAVLCQPVLPTVTGFSPLDFGPEIARYSEDFTGRNWLNSELDLWLSTSEGRAFFIVGEPGVGKSAIAAWISQVRSEQVVAVYFCTQRKTRTLDPFEFVACLIAQLCTQIDGYLELVQERCPEAQRSKAADAFRELIIEPTRNLSAPTKPAIIIIDSLDEADTQSGETIVDVILQQAEDLPPWLRIVATTRPSARALHQTRRLNTFQLKAERTDNLVDVAQYILQRINTPILAERIGDQVTHVANRLEALAKGNFLYTKMALEALESGALGVEDLGELIPGLSDFYAKAFSREFDDVEVYLSDYAPLLSTLAVAQGSMPLKILQPMTDTTLEVFHRRIRTLRPYLRLSSHLENVSYSLFHRSLQDWLIDPNASGAYWCDPRSAHSGLTDYLYENWQDSDYALRHLPEHLFALSREADVIQLFCDKGFMRARLESGISSLEPVIEKVMAGFGGPAQREDEPGEDDLIQALDVLVDIFYSRNDLTKAMEMLTMQEKILRRSRKYIELASCLGTQAMIQEDLGKTDEAYDNNEFDFQMVDAYRPVLESPEEYSSLQISRVALLLRETGHPAEALSLYEYLADYFRETGSKDVLQKSLANQAVILSDREDLDGAMELYKESEMICREIGNNDGLSTSLTNQANTLRARGDLDGAMKLLKESERICREFGSKESLERSLANQAAILGAQGDLDGAMKLHKERERICRELGNNSGLSSSLANQASILFSRGDLDGAMELYKEQERICRELGNKDGLSTSLGNQAVILGTRGNLGEAMMLLKEQESIFRELGNKDGLQSSLSNQAVILRARGDLDGAMELHKESERICRELGSKDGLSSSLANQASILFSRGDLDGAMELFKESERICRELGSKDGLSSSLANQASILFSRGDLDGAMELYKEQERICRELGNKDGLAKSLGSQALILRARGVLDGAMKLHEESGRIFRELGNKDVISTSLGSQEVVQRDLGDLGDTMKLLKEEERICRELGNKDGLAKSLGSQAVILKAQGDLDGAMELYKESEGICREIGNKDGLSSSLTNQANILRAQGDLDGAMGLYKESEGICRELGSKDSLEKSLANQAVILSDRGDLDGAMGLYKESEEICREIGNKDDLVKSLFIQAMILDKKGMRIEALALAIEAYQLAADHGYVPLAQQIRIFLDSLEP